MRRLQIATAAAASATPRGAVRARGFPAGDCTGRSGSVHCRRRRAPPAGVHGVAGAVEFAAPTGGGAGGSAGGDECQCATGGGAAWGMPGVVIERGQELWGLVTGEPGGAVAARPVCGASGDGESCLRRPVNAERPVLDRLRLVPGGRRPAMLHCTPHAIPLQPHTTPRPTWCRAGSASACAPQPWPCNN